MADRSCCDCSSESDTFFDDLLRIFIRGGSIAVFFSTISYFIVKTAEHSDEIKELFSRLEECEKNRELKK